MKWKDPKRELPEPFVYVNVRTVHGTTHRCEINDLEDGLDFEQWKAGNWTDPECEAWYWLEEDGKRIKDVVLWCPLPLLKVA